MYSQILSNFKLFSKPRESEINIISNIGKSSTGYYQNIGYYIFAIMLIGICGVAYYKQDDINNMLNSWIGKIWLLTHLTSDGELSSTHVPAKFSFLSKST